MARRLADADNVVKQVAQGETAQALRERGALIMIEGATGNIHFADAGVASMLGREGLTRNGFDMIPPETASEAGAMIAKFIGQDFKGWFPLLSDDGDHIWCRYELHWIHGLMLLGLWLEEDESKWAITGQALE